MDLNLTPDAPSEDMDLNLTPDAPSEDMDLNLTPDAPSITSPSPADDGPSKPIQYVIALKKMGFLRWQSEYEEGEGSDDDEEVTSESKVDLSGLLAHKKFFKKVVDRNPAYDTRWTIKDDAMVTFDATRAPSGITMLLFEDCEKLEVVDLSGFRELRFLGIRRCPELGEMIGCECLEELGLLEIDSCPSYHGYPPLHKMPSLQEFRFLYSRDDVRTGSPKRVLRGGELDVSGCVRLRTLEIVGDWALSSIRGLEGLRSLTELVFWGCEALGKLPDIGHMKALTHLTISQMPVKEIKGVEKLSNLKELDCRGLKLKTLPDLSHLPHLEDVALDGCPVVEDASSPHYRKQPGREFCCESEHVDVSESE